MSRKVVKKAQDLEKRVSKSVKEQQKELQEILPNSKEGTVLISCQIGDMSITLPLPELPYVNDVLRKGKVKNRSILEIFGAKLGVDIT